MYLWTRDSLLTVQAKNMRRDEEFAFGAATLIEGAGSILFEPFHVHRGTDVEHRRSFMLTENMEGPARVAMPPTEDCKGSGINLRLSS